MNSSEELFTMWLVVVEKGLEFSNDLWYARIANFENI